MAKSNALDTFVAVTAEIDALLVDLKALADDHFGTEPDRVDWSHVESALRVKALIGTALRFAQGKGD